MTHTPVPGERVAGYDVSDRLGTDYYAVFADIPDADRAVWDRAKTFIDEALPRMDGLWDRGEYDLDLTRRMGELDLYNDGLVHEGLGYSSPLAAGLVNMEISRGDGSLGTVVAVQGGLALRSIALFGSDEQKARVARPGRPRRGARGVRAHRARPRLRLRLARDRGRARRRDAGCSTAPRSGSATAPPAASRSSGRA